MRAWLVLLALLLAGCGGEPAAEPQPQTTTATPLTPEQINETTPPPPTTATWSFTMCRQLHGAFPGTADQFAPFLPDGFELHDPDNDGVINVLVENTLCDASRMLAAGAVTDDLPLGSEYVMFQVRPPSSPDDGRSEWFAMDAIMAQPDVQAAIDALGGGGVESGEVTLDETDFGAGYQATWRMVGISHTYSVRGPLSNPSGDFAASQDRVWLAVGGEVVGVVERDHSESTDDGTGAGVFLNTGGGDAPFSMEGLLHHVRGLDGTAVYRPVGTLDWFTP